MDNKILIAIVAVIVVVAAGAAYVALTPSQDNAVHYNGNGGTCSNNKTWDSTESTVPTYIVIRDGYNFNDWNTKADGSGTAYKAGDKVGMGTTLYAQWGDPTISVDLGLFAYSSFVAYLGSSDSGSTLTQVESGFKYPVPSNPVIRIEPKVTAGLQFVKAYGNEVYFTYADEGTSIHLSCGLFPNLTIDSINSTSTGVDIRVTTTGPDAVLEVGSVSTGSKVGYIANNGTSEDYDTTDLVAKAVGTSPGQINFTNGGKTFTKWNTKADGTGVDVAIGDTVPFCIVLYAQWSA